MVDLFDTPGAWLPVIDENPRLPGFHPKTIVGWTVVICDSPRARATMTTPYQVHLSGSKESSGRPLLKEQRLLKKDTTSISSGMATRNKMQQSHTLRAVGFCDGSDLPDKMRTPFIRTMKLCEYHSIEFLRRIKCVEVDETPPDGNCGFRVSERFLRLIRIIAGGPLEATAPQPLVR